MKQLPVNTAELVPNTTPPPVPPTLLAVRRLEYDLLLMIYKMSVKCPIAMHIM